MVTLSGSFVGKLPEVSVCIFNKLTISSLWVCFFAVSTSALLLK